MAKKVKIPEKVRVLEVIEHIEVQDDFVQLHYNLYSRPLIGLGWRSDGSRIKTIPWSMMPERRGTVLAYTGFGEMIIGEPDGRKTLLVDKAFPIGTQVSWRESTFSLQTIKHGDIVNDHAKPVYLKVQRVPAL